MNFFSDFRFRNSTLSRYRACLSERAAKFLAQFFITLDTNLEKSDKVEDLG
jgi:hypothetical protein